MSNANQAGASPEEFHDLEPLHELEPLPAEPEPAAPVGAPAKAAPRAPARASGPVDIEQAPLMLQKAALILFVAALLPWLVPEGFNIVRLGAKAVVLLGGWVAYCAVEHEMGVKTPLDGLGKMHKLALPVLTWVLIGAGVFLTLLAPEWQGVIEASAVAVGILAWAQVHGYSRSGKFNPIWALVIPMFGLAALANAIVLLVKDFDPAPKWLGILGSLGITGAGAFAGYTLFVSMKEAKAHGEAKKRAAMEARAAERKAKRDRETPGGSAAPKA